MQALEKTTDADVDAELNLLPTQTIAILRNRYRELYRKKPPPAFGPDLLRRTIAYHIQEKTFGGLPSSARDELDRNIKAISKAPSGHIELPRRIKAGAVLIREWKGKTYRVTVVDDGFIYEEHNYSSLSEIAREITGARWNGPRFFGLRKSTPAHKPNLKASAAEALTGAL
jgi:hypothetical protein